MKKDFFAGLIILLPLALAIFILGWAVHFFTDPFLAITQKYLALIPFVSPLFLARISILILLLFSTVLLGFIAHHFFSSFFLFFYRIVDRIPFVKTIYSIIRNVFSSFVGGRKRKIFQSPCLTSLLSEDSQSIGFISGEVPKAWKKQLKNKDMVSVIVPTIHIFTGFFMILPKKKIKKIPLTNEDALKWTISCGTIVPEKESDHGNTPS